MCEANEAIALRVTAREHTPSAWAAHRTCGKVIGKLAAVFSYGVNGWCVYCFDAITTKVTAGVVGGDDDDIGFGHV